MQGKSILVRVSEGSSYRESTVILKTSVKLIIFNPLAYEILPVDAV